jgi:DNA-binding transcriptional regulator YhcF (GntR family)
MNIDTEPELILDGSTTANSQIREQLRELIEAGALHPGEELPTVRCVAVELGVPPSVVQAAYDELVRDGLLDSLEGAAPRVLAHDTTQQHETWNYELTALCHDFLSRTRASGFNHKEVLRMLRTLIESEDRHE